MPDISLATILCQILLIENGAKENFSKRSDCICTLLVELSTSINKDNYAKIDKKVECGHEL